MVMERKIKPMRHWDWKNLFPRGFGRVVRIDLPMPNDVKGVYKMQQTLTKLHYELQEAAEEFTNTNGQPLNLMRDVKAAYAAFKTNIGGLQRKWQDDYLELHKAEIKGMENQEVEENVANTLRERHPPYLVGEGQ